MKKFLFALMALVMMSSVAMAVPINTGTISFGGGNGLLKWEAEDAGGGLTLYKVSLDDPSDAQLSWFLQATSFTGKINQIKAFAAIAVDDNVNAGVFAVTPGSGYSSALDSYFFQPFYGNLQNPPGVTDSNATQGVQQRTYAITAGSGGGSKLDFVQFAQIVAEGSIVVSGDIAREGSKLVLDPPTFENNNNSMTPTPIPEPSTFVLLGLGVVGLVGFAKRRKSA